MKLFRNSQTSVNARQDFPIEIDDSPLDTPVRLVQKRHMEDDAAAESPLAWQRAPSESFEDQISGARQLEEGLGKARCD